MADGRLLRPLGELTNNFDAARVPVKESDRRRGPYPYYGASGVIDYVDRFLFDGEYLLVAEDGENLRTRQTPVAFMACGKFWVNNHAHVVQGNPEADTRYLMYAMRVADISAYLTGSTMPKLTQGNLNHIPVIAPSLTEQRAIAAVLGTLDNKIEVNRKTALVLERIARAVFQSWFVDFDPVRRAAAGQPIGLPANLAALFPNRLVDSPIGEAPEGWTVEMLGDMLNLSRDAVEPGDHPMEQFDHFSIPAFDAGQIPSKDAGESILSQKVLVHDGSVLVSKLNPRIPRVWFPPLAGSRRQVASTEFFVCTGDASKNVSREFVYCLASSGPLIEHLSTHASGTSNSHQRVRPQDFLGFRCVQPPPNILAAFTRTVKPAFERIVMSRAQSVTLATLRDTLLPKLISGELRIPDAEKIVGRAV